MTETATTTPADIDTVVEAYFAMLNETDPARRAEHIAVAWAPDGAYADPLQEAAGHQGLSEMVDAVQGQYPGRAFRRTTAIDSHHGFHRFGWQLGEGDDLVVDGLDVAHVGADGRLTGIVAFFGPLAGGAA
ncbi:hypothetical protein BH10ACT1_BH10ACT1_06550 [soil metagenome]